MGEFELDATGLLPVPSLLGWGRPNTPGGGKAPGGGKPHSLSGWGTTGGDVIDPSLFDLSVTRGSSGLLRGDVMDPNLFDLVAAEGSGLAAADPGAPPEAEEGLAGLLPVDTEGLPGEGEAAGGGTGLP